MLRYLQRGLSTTNKTHDPWRREDWQAILGIEPAKDIAGEQELFNCLFPVRPTPLRRTRRRKLLEAAFPQMDHRQTLVIRPDAEGEPGIGFCPAGAFELPQGPWMQL